MCELAIIKLFTIFFRLVSLRIAYIGQNSKHLYDTDFRVKIGSVQR